MKMNTSFGSELSIENNDILVFNNDTRVSMKKIISIGDYKFVTNIDWNKKVMSVFLVLGIIFLFFAIKLIYDPHIAWKGLVSSDGRSLEEVDDLPDMITWIFSILFFGAALIFNSRIRTIKNIDPKKNDYELTIRVLIKDDPDPKKRVIKNMTICKGSFEELKEIRQVILVQKGKVDLL